METLIHIGRVDAQGNCMIAGVLRWAGSSQPQRCGYSAGRFGPARIARARRNMWGSKRSNLSRALSHHRRRARGRRQVARGTRFACALECLAPWHAVANWGLREGEVANVPLPALCNAAVGVGWRGCTFTASSPVSRRDRLRRADPSGQLKAR
jgi:hypothetical protein